MTDTDFTLVVSFAAIAVFIAFVVLFFLVSNLKGEILYLDQRVESRAYDTTVQVMSRTTYETRDKLDALADHLNIKIVNQEARKVVEPKGEVK